jgi:hypothetical protein
MNRRSRSVPDTSKSPDERTLRQTTLFPRKRPAKRTKTDPGATVARTFGAFLTGIGPFLMTTSSAG